MNEVKMNDKDKIKKVLEIAYQYGQIDGGHHKAWVIDQMVMILTGDKYDEWKNEYTSNDEYEWDKGIAP